MPIIEATTAIGLSLRDGTLEGLHADVGLHGGVVDLARDAHAGCAAHCEERTVALRAAFEREHAGDGHEHRQAYVRSARRRENQKAKERNDEARQHGRLP